MVEFNLQMCHACSPTKFTVGRYITTVGRYITTNNREFNGDQIDLRQEACREPRHPQGCKLSLLVSQRPPASPRDLSLSLTVCWFVYAVAMVTARLADTGLPPAALGGF